MTTLRIIPLFLLCASALGQTYSGCSIIGANGVADPVLMPTTGPRANSSLLSHGACAF